uniref:Uncharacterized protein n=1 Tax=Lepeophtheirus salmonis TaxID=72036 RepID=A0A0K2VG44_LEPSM
MQIIGGWLLEWSLGGDEHRKELNKNIQYYVHPSLGENSLLLDASLRL